MSNRQPRYILAISPTNKIEIPEFFNSEANPLVDILKNPPVLRELGWNTLTLDEPRIQSGMSWTVRNGDRKIFHLSSEGILVGMVHADESFLGWGRDTDQFQRDPRIINLALIEYTYDFVNMYKEMLALMPPISALTIFISFKNITESENGLRFDTNEINVLNRSPLTDISSLSGDFESSLMVNISNNSFRAEEVAYKVLSNIYARVGIASNHIPYTKSEDGGRVVDFQRIQAIR